MAGSKLSPPPKPGPLNWHNRYAWNGPDDRYKVALGGSIWLREATGGYTLPHGTIAQAGSLNADTPPARSISDGATCQAKLIQNIPWQLSQIRACGYQTSAGCRSSVPIGAADVPWGEEDLEVYAI